MPGYAGETATVAYIDKVRCFIKDYLYPKADFTRYLNFYQTWDSEPIENIPKDIYRLPSRAIADNFIRSLFVTYSPDLYYLVHPTAMDQYMDICFNDPGNDHTLLALVNAGLALGAQASGSPPSAPSKTPGMEYFARARKLLEHVKEHNSIISMQVLNILVASP